MPSEHQLQMAEKEVADLERELKSLEDATDAKESANRIMDYISNNDEPLTEFPDDPCCACCVIL